MILLDRRRRPVFVELMLELYEVDSAEGSFASAVKEMDLWRVIWDIGVRETVTGALSEVSVCNCRLIEIQRTLYLQLRSERRDSRGQCRSRGRNCASEDAKWWEDNTAD
jgi:hypothetical protein